MSTADLPMSVRRTNYSLYCADAFEWMGDRKRSSIHAIVTDPPYGLLEYRPNELEKMKRVRGGVWRIPPSFDGCQRRPLPRFTVLRQSDRAALREFFSRLAERLMPVLVPSASMCLISFCQARFWNQG